jgi:hypothetical protein
MHGLEEVRLAGLVRRRVRFLLLVPRRRGGESRRGERERAGWRGLNNFRGGER